VENSLHLPIGAISGSNGLCQRDCYDLKTLEKQLEISGPCISPVCPRHPDGHPQPDASGAVGWPTKWRFSKLLTKLKRV